MPGRPLTSVMAARTQRRPLEFGVSDSGWSRPVRDDPAVGEADPLPRDRDSSPPSLVAVWRNPWRERGLGEKEFLYKSRF